MSLGAAIAEAIDRRRSDLKPYDEGLPDSAGIPLTLRELIENPTPYASSPGPNDEYSPMWGGNLEGWSFGQRYTAQLDGQTGRPCRRPVLFSQIPDPKKRPKGPACGGEEEHLHLGVLARASHEWMTDQGIDVDIDHALTETPWPVLAYLVDVLEQMGFPEGIYFPQQQWAYETGEWFDPANGCLPVYDYHEWEGSDEHTVISFLGDLHMAMHGNGRVPAFPESALSFTVHQGRVKLRQSLAPRRLIDRATEVLADVVAGQHRDKLRRPWPAALQAMAECSFGYLALYGDQLCDMTFPLTSGEEVGRFVQLCREVAHVRRYTDQLVRQVDQDAPSRFWHRLIEDLLRVGGDTPCGI